MYYINRPYGEAWGGGLRPWKFFGNTDKMAGKRHAAIPAAPSTPYVVLPIVIDYTMIVVICVTLAFWIGVLIDGHIIHPFERAKADKKSSFELFFDIILQFTVQGLIALLVTFAVRAIPSPVEGVMGYSAHSATGNAVRTPAMVLFAIVLLTVSSSLQARITYIISRFDKNTCPVRAAACPPPLQPGSHGDVARA